MKTIDQTIAELKARDPAFREAYEALEPEYQRRRALIEARLAKAWTQRDLAEKLGTTQSVISRLESGAHIPSVTTLHRLAEMLDIQFAITPTNSLAVSRASKQPAKRSARRAGATGRPVRSNVAPRP